MYVRDALDCAVVLPNLHAPIPYRRVYSRAEVISLAANTAAGMACTCIQSQMV